MAVPTPTRAAHVEDEASRRTLCLGRPATVVGRPGTRLSGTDGPDVIVSNGAHTVLAGAGADLVCMTGSERGNTVKAGRGDDRVVNQVTNESVGADLGSGRDRYVGGPSSDSVTTYGGDDTVRLGAGTDSVTANLADGPGSVLDGGPGRDNARIVAAPGLPGSLVVDTARGRFRAGATTPVRTLTGFEVFELGDRRRVSSFRGSGAAEEVTVEGRIGTVDLRGGDDDFTLDVSYPLSFRDRFSVADAIRGGTGRDLFSFTSRGADLDVDLPAGRLVVAYDDYTRQLAVGGFNDLDLNGQRVDVRGTDESNVIDLIVCTGTIEAGGDDDTVLAYAAYNESYGYYCPPRSPGVTVLGGDGDDSLFSGDLDDVLVGGAGTDRADAGGGTDECDAETVTRCEVGPRPR